MGRWRSTMRGPGRAGRSSPRSWPTCERLHVLEELYQHLGDMQVTADALGS
jgi:hypothetical protein